MKKILFLLGMTIIAMACTKTTFTAEERSLIGIPAHGIMRVWKTDNPSDSLLLRRTSDPLEWEDLKTETYKTLQERMLETVNDPENPGVGIAAPQVGLLRQVVAVQRFDQEGEPFGFYVNPRIESYSEETALGREGCLSIPERSGQVRRSESIVISYLDGDTGERVQEQVSGFTAVIFQHEIDHLNGILYIDREEEPEDSPNTDTDEEPTAGQ